MPAAADTPCPSEPVLMSTPGVPFMSGWPCKNPSSERSFTISDCGKYPLYASAPYSAGAACPFESTSRSRLGQSGFCGSMFSSAS